MAKEHEEHVHGEIVRELTARRTALMHERSTLQQAAQRLVEIDATIAALDVEIDRSTAKLPKSDAAVSAIDAVKEGKK